ncbi:GNAT family N-acetyltransferase [Chromobacterium alticapitis]|uniref:GNAT family N-acetyltransferase n=1 Tax=Chromobacterium alticapitis TaxID=2073169 RepID=A0A2S5DDJ9_9NEIS|nr:GNAT family N-acetyltransferase [Chromobacterium alticapitis]POZ61134.1 GNAT family N-acetyltransferase [Chromobacterium alticapitis]
MSLEIRDIDTSEGLRACFPLMRQLRPHLSGPDELVERWERQRREGYRLLGLYQDERLVALAGWRPTENLVHGRHMYVDDLVTDESCRGQKLGEALLNHLRRLAGRHDCAKLLLDTPMANTLGHRFYYRQGLVATALRFLQPLRDPSA